MSSDPKRQCPKCKVRKTYDRFTERSSATGLPVRWCRDCIKQHHSQPGFLERRRAYSRQPEVQERRREYAGRPEVQERRRTRARHPEVQERRREYNSRPEVRERKQAYEQRPEVQERKRQSRGRSEARHAKHRRNIKERYGVDYDKRFEQQGGRCAVDGEPETVMDRHGNLRKLVVDHDHKTGVFRGLICGSHNTGIGYFHDDPDELLAGAEYLLRHRDILRPMLDALS